METECVKFIQPNGTKGYVYVLFLWPFDLVTIAGSQLRLMEKGMDDIIDFLYEIKQGG
jgi:hypothetical protein